MNLLTAHLGAGLWLASWGITGALNSFLAVPLAWLLNSFVERGILTIDITVNAIKMGLRMAEFKRLAEDAHKRATKRVYTEEEKKAIREEYLKHLRDFVRFGRVRDKHP